MKPEEYYANKSSQIINTSAAANFQVSGAAKNGDYAMDQLRLRIFDFLALTPDETGFEVSHVWVGCWKRLYDRISKAITELKKVDDYRLDSKRRELSAIATALLASRKAVYWED